MSNEVLKIIDKVLIANRGEIALRVIKTCKEMGIKTVTIFTEKERAYPHAYLSDESFSLGEGALSETYLNQDKIIEIAKLSGAKAIHPGYGFLSENSGFAEKVTKAGIKFIGPRPDSMEIMGDKKTSKIEMEKISIPLIPGYHGDNQDENYLADQAKKIGFPVLIKASAGGGGKGMRVVEKSSDFSAALASAKREAMNAFGDDIVLIEKFIQNPRHIEVQVMSDTHGNHLHFFERECSIQRRHQKVVEETPSTALGQELRDKITQTAVQISSGINYEGAGTVEFIMDANGEFFFLEMNTRLQVEHPITEMVTGSDLVRLQIIAAAGLPINLKQSDIKQSGHAIEVRIYSEDPDNNFMPAIGTISRVGNTTLNDVRLDSGYVDGNEVTINFDPMLAKLVCWGVDREAAISKTLFSLDEVVFLGVQTNRDYLKRIVNSAPFRSGDTFTHFIETYSELLLKQEMSDDQIASCIAAFINSSVSKSNNSNEGSWSNLQGFRNI
ncbi:acetyl/propionyl/methylcrotonyl-CoA carboxylase subunit alpha [Halobacteriovorax sp. HLS]|uniref:acetyl-CoA carboxylase biotin carboxylase subunit n=1 Tax=Halobacteriovorax sp. HLS TaxID=2234000 RepID=UPI000FD94AED|nr:biotin carboxylase N-terminal domain-containing protein [Halobacteriovorax sp. HLS]